MRVSSLTICKLTQEDHLVKVERKITAGMTHRRVHSRSIRIQR